MVTYRDKLELKQIPKLLSIYIRYIIIMINVNNANSAQVGCRLPVSCYQFNTMGLANTLYLPTNTSI